MLQLLILISSLASANISATEVHTAVIGSSSNFIKNGTFRGGDSLANPVALSGVRWAQQKGFERVVIDLEGDGRNWEDRVPPYFQIGVDETNVDVNIRGISQQKLNKASLSYVIRKSALIRNIYVAPDIQGDLASIRFNLKNRAEVKSFYLVRPPRIILDIRAQ